MTIPFGLRSLTTQPWPSGALTLPRVQAHRGLWTAGPGENTLEAFRAARTAGYAMAELDVRISRDGQAVVFHDDDLSRHGSAQRVRDLTAAELRERVNAPSLREVLADPGGPEFYNIEIKAPSSIAGLVEPAVARVIREAGAQHRVLISSFNPLSLGLLSELLPDVPLALLATARREKGNSLPLRQMWLAPLLKIHMLNLDDLMMTPELISFLRAKCLKYAVWTVNDEERARALLETGAASVISDRVRPDLTVV